MPVGVPDVVQLHLLGPVSVTRPGGGDGALLTAPRRLAVLAVLAYLAIARPRGLIESTAGQLTDGPPENAADILNPPPLRLALACAELGEWDRARAWEEHACTRRPGQRQWFIAHPELAPIHDGSALKNG